MSIRVREKVIWEYYIDGFEEPGRGHEQRNESRLRSWKRQGNRLVFNCQGTTEEWSPIIFFFFFFLL